MSEFSDTDFTDPIRCMNDSALLRLDAIKADELDSMRHGDEYFSTITKQRTTKHFWETSFDTTLRVGTVSSIADAIMQHDTPADHFRGVLGGMILSLADKRDLMQDRRVTPLSFDLDHTKKLVDDAWVTATVDRQERRDFKLYSFDMGHVAVTSVFFAFTEASQSWQLGYEMNTSMITYGSTPELGEIEIVDYVED